MDDVNHSGFVNSMYHIKFKSLDTKIDRRIVINFIREIKLVERKKEKSIFNTSRQTCDESDLSLFRISFSISDIYDERVRLT